ncbi:MAG TPA: hypothetical protein V6C90_14685 [Coleofasciculaceae cyanobacterium]
MIIKPILIAVYGTRLQCCDRPALKRTFHSSRDDNAIALSRTPLSVPPTFMAVSEKALTGLAMQRERQHEFAPRFIVPV